MRKTVSILTIVFVLWATVFCCCSQALTLAKQTSSSCCHKDASKMDTITKASSGHECHCQKIEGIFSLNSESQNANPLTNLSFLDAYVPDKYILLASSLKSLEDPPHRFSSAIPLYLQISILRI